jgi:hypothetical protein
VSVSQNLNSQVVGTGSPSGGFSQPLTVTSSSDEYWDKCSENLSISNLQNLQPLPASNDFEKSCLN